MEGQAAIQTRTVSDGAVAATSTTVVDTRDFVSWGSIWAGLLTAFGIFVLLSVIALAAGLEVAPFGDAPVDPRYGPQIAAIVTGIFIVVAFLAGGFAAAWTADLANPGRAMLHGFLVWALFIVVVLALAAAGLSGALSPTTNVFGAFDPETTVEAFQTAAWGTVFGLVLAMAAAVLGALLATRDEVRNQWPLRG